MCGGKWLGMCIYIYIIYTLSIHYNDIDIYIYIYGYRIYFISVYHGIVSHQTRQIRCGKPGWKTAKFTMGF